MAVTVARMEYTGLRAVVQLNSNKLMISIFIIVFLTPLCGHCFPYTRE